MNAAPIEGDMAPSFSLPAVEGKAVSLTDLRGSRLALFFYPKDDTSGCTQEALEFEALADAFAAAGCTVLGVSPDSLKSHEKYRGKYGLHMNLLSDETKEMLAAYGVWQEKSMYGRKYMGVERSTFLIDSDGRIAKAWRKVKVPGHAAEVLAAAKMMV